MSIHQTPNCLPFMTTKTATRRITTNMKKRPHMPSNEVRACASSSKDDQQAVIRRSANYQPCIWDYGFVQSLKSDYVGEKYMTQSNKLKEDVRIMLQTVVEPLDQLQLIDILQRLGLSYHFNDEIKGLLERIYSNNNKWKKEDLYGVALKFRLLRQHGYLVSQEVFKRFTDVNGNFICKDSKGMLSLYEASYLSMEGESLLVEARNFTANHLKDYDSNDVSHALELPLYWRMLRLEARWSIDVYQRQQDKNSVILELAKLDFNMVQAIHQEDLKHMSRWWRSTCLGGKLSFARDRLMESFFWTVGGIFEPQFGYCRRMTTKLNALITTIDDVYDVYGSLDELEIFTDVVRRWDINAIDILPDYMKICFLALFNSINEMAYDALKDQDCNIIKYLQKSWADLCESYLLEAKWYYSGYTPTLEEYIDNAWISISAPLILVHVYFFVTNPITKEALECLEKYPNIIRWPSLILRLADDLGTSSDELNRGDVPKSIQCYMYETGASEEDARDHIRYLISKTWEKINEERLVCTPFSETFIGIAMNLARMAQCMYQYGDGYGVPDRETKDRVLSLLIQPIP